MLFRKKSEFSILFSFYRKAWRFATEKCVRQRAERRRTGCRRLPIGAAENVCMHRKAALYGGGGKLPRTAEASADASSPRQGEGLRRAHRRGPLHLGYPAPLFPRIRLSANSRMHIRRFSTARRAAACSLGKVIKCRTQNENLHFEA